MFIKHKYECSCGSLEFYIESKKTTKGWKHVGLYCDHCNKWIKWVNKKEQQELKEYYDVKEK